MNKRTLGVAAVFLVGCAVGGASSQLMVPKASAQQAATLTKWEYHCLTDEFDALPESSRQLGAEGWEMVAFDIAGGSRTSRTCYKRPKM